MKLTRATVVRLRLPPRKDDVIYFDDTLPGFGIRLRTKGARTWVLQYRRGRQQRRLTLGTVEVLSADQARQAARDRLAMIQLGGDPQADKIKAISKAATTLSGVVERYLTYKTPTLRPKSVYETERYLRKHWKPLHELPIHEIRRGDVAACLTKIQSESEVSATASLDDPCARRLGTSTGRDEGTAARHEQRNCAR